MILGYKYPYNLNFDQNQKGLADNPSLNILFVGDIMLDRNVRNIIDKNGFDSFFSGVKNLIKDADIAVGNLEGTFTPYESITASLQSKELQFTFDPALAPSLADLGFDILGLANNHSMNFGSVGLEMTKRYIGSAGMFYYGDPNNKDEISTIITKNGIKIGLIGFHEFTYVNFDKVFVEISSLRKEVDVLVVVPHWGIEYQKEPTEKMRQWAHQFIDLGADAVIGAHSHIIGQTETYKDKKIFYSLGNFAFDQYFSKETMKGLTVLMKIQKNSQKNDKSKIIDLDYTLIPIKVDRVGVNFDFS